MTFLAYRAFPELFAVTGAKVPDLRGYFLRGYGGKSAGLGVHQDFEKLDHTHPVGGTVGYIGYVGGGYGGFISYQGYNGDTVYGLNQSGPANYNSNVENRPTNKAVRYLIRARP